MPVTPEDRRRQQQQAPAEIRLEWGPHGLRRLAPVVETIVIVDVLSFTTAVTVAAEAGAVVLPYRWKDGTEAAYAADNDAVLAGPPRRLDELSLSPTSLQSARPAQRIVLPSANGSALAFAARDEFGVARVLAASLRNATAVARAAAGTGGPVGIVPAGERWHGDTGPMRVALEDHIGAGAVVAAFPSALRRSPEAAAAAAVFHDAESALYERLAATASGKELIEAGFGTDVLLAGSHDVTDVVPALSGVAFVAA